ncbi:hypothetical protein HRG_012919 [Hirsutella rhossiliensis]
MAPRTIYLAKYRSGSQRAHFAIFVPNSAGNHIDLEKEFRSVNCPVTVIHVVGEPLMSGFALEIKRNYDGKYSLQLEKVTALGSIDSAHIFEPPNKEVKTESITRCKLEREAAQVPPPPKGQDLRAPIDGVKTKRCQEWTMEFLKRLVTEGLLTAEAVGIAEKERDPPTLGIFGYK